MITALQQVEIAKEDIVAGDYIAARKRLIEIQCHFPAFTDISGMITVCDILHSAGYEFLGCGTDYYWVLEVPPNSSELVTRTQYNKLTSLLKPIKNNFPGAESAMKIIEEAFAALSNSEKRSLYVMKRAKMLQSCSFGNLKDVRAADSQHGYLWKSAEDLTCSLGSDGFSTKLSLAKTAMTSKKCYQGYNTIFSDKRKVEGFSVGQIWATYDEENMPRKYAQIVNIKNYEPPFRMYINWVKPAPTTVHEKRWCEAGLPVACGLFSVDRTQATALEPISFSHLVSLHASQKVEIYPRKGEIWAVYKDWKPVLWCKNPEARKGCILKLVEIAIGYSNQDDMLFVHLEKVEGQENVYRRCTYCGSECFLPIPPRDLLMFSHRVPACTLVGGDSMSNGMLELDPSAVPDIVDSFVTNGSSCNSTFDLAHSVPALTPLEAEIELQRHKKSAKDFMSDQVWAVYCGPDSMPRRYVVVNDVVSENDISVTSLEANPQFVDELNWVTESLPFVCGLFKAGKITLNLGLSSFSHIANCEVNKDKSLYRIFPKKGEIWTMYRNWSSGWKPADFINYKCQIVEVVTDYSEESGLIVASLEQVPGWTNLFQRQLHDGFELVKAIPRREMLRFSHQISVSTVPLTEAYDIPQGSLYLDPDSLPPMYILNCS